MIFHEDKMITTAFRSHSNNILPGRNEYYGTLWLRSSFFSRRNNKYDGLFRHRKWFFTNTKWLRRHFEITPITFYRGEMNTTALLGYRNWFFLVRFVFFDDGIKNAVVMGLGDGSYDGIAECRRELTGLQVVVTLLIDIGWGNNLLRYL